MGSSITTDILSELDLSLCQAITLCHLSERFSKSDFAERTEKKFNVPTKQLTANEIEITETKKLDIPF